MDLRKLKTLIDLVAESLQAGSTKPRTGVGRRFHDGGSHILLGTQRFQSHSSGQGSFWSEVVILEIHCFEFCVVPVELVAISVAFNEAIFRDPIDPGKICPIRSQASGLIRADAGPLRQADERQ